jgi:hypothetical protein
MAQEHLQQGLFNAQIGLFPNSDQSQAKLASENCQFLAQAKLTSSIEIAS